MSKLKRQGAKGKSPIPRKSDGKYMNKAPNGDTVNVLEKKDN